MKFDLIGLGECMVEFHAEEPLGHALDSLRGYGGDVLNALVAAARRGGRTAFMTRVGNDPFGPRLLAAWRDEGIDTRHAPLVPGENGIYCISLDAAGERSFTYRRAGSAASRLGPGDIDADLIASARCVLLSGITQAISPTARAATLAAARIARTQGVTVAYDPNYRPALWAPHGGLDAARAAAAELLPLTDILLPSLPDDGAVLAGAPHELALHVAAKRGARGCTLWLDGQATDISAAAVAVVVDTTGAGDAWNGSYLLAIMQGMPPAAAATRANIAAAAKLAHRGAIPPKFINP